MIEILKLIWYKKITHIYCIYNGCLKIDFKFQKIKLKIFYVCITDAKILILNFKK